MAILSPKRYLEFEEWLAKKGLEYTTVTDIISEYNEFIIEMRAKEQNERAD